MSLTWGDIRRSFIDAAGGSAAASNECWKHLTEAARTVYSQVEVAELTRTADVTVGLDPSDATQFADYIELDPQIYAIRSVVNITDGFPVFPEPSGVMGRDRYLNKTTGKPSNGNVRNWAREGNRLYLRDTPLNQTTLRIHYLLETPVLSDADQASHPLTPDHLDWAIVHAAAFNYYLLHPRENTADGEHGQTLAQKHQQAMQAKMVAPAVPVVIEDKARYQRTRLAGYRLSPRSRR